MYYGAAEHRPDRPGPPKRVVVALWLEPQPPLDEPPEHLLAGGIWKR